MVGSDNEPVKWPEDTEHLLTWYWDIRRRTAVGMDINPISTEGIEGYARRLNRMGFEMQLLEEELLERIDDIYMDVLRKSRETPPKKPRPTKH